MRDEKYRIICVKRYSVLELYAKALCQSPVQASRVYICLGNKGMFFILQLICMYMSVVSAIALFPLLHKLGRLMGKKEKYMDTCISLASIVVYIALLKEGSGNCNFLNYLFTIQSSYFFLYAFPLEYYINKTTDNTM